jgi:hypothetical protein
MGERPWGLPRLLSERLIEGLGLRIAIETGTYFGHSAATLAELTTQVWTVEQDRSLYDHACKRFSNIPNVTPIWGPSPEVLSRLLPHIPEAALFWLDAHWFHDIPGEDRPQCPLMDEITEINSWVHASDSCLLIDDARMFMARLAIPYRKSDWPRFLEIIDALRQIPQRYITILEDVIISGPPAVEDIIDQYWIDVQPVPG